MMPLADLRCPLDGSKLIFLAGHYAFVGRPDTAAYYCPRCDAGFVCFDDPAAPRPAVFTWRRRAGAFYLDPEDLPRAAAYKDRGWQAARWQMLRGVRDFLEHRFSAFMTCPNDGGRIPLVAEVPCGQGFAQFSWCAYCGELFGSLRDEDYGWQCLATFSHEPGTGYQLRRASGDAAQVEGLRAAVAQVPAPPGFAPRR